MWKICLQVVTALIVTSHVTVQDFVQPRESPVMMLHGLRTRESPPFVLFQVPKLDSWENSLFIFLEKWKVVTGFIFVSAVKWDARVTAHTGRFTQANPLTEWSSGTCIIHRTLVTYREWLSYRRMEAGLVGNICIIKKSLCVGKKPMIY